MTRELSVTDWQQYRTTVSNDTGLQVRPREGVEIPPLPLGLNNSDPYGVTHYIIRLMQAVVKAGVKGTFWEIRHSDRVLFQQTLTKSKNPNYIALLEKGKVNSAFSLLFSR